MLALVSFKNKQEQADKIAQFKEGIQAEYAAKGDAYFSTAKLWDDGVV